MFSFAGKGKNKSVAAVVPGDMGIAVAMLGPATGSGKPKLELCDFTPWQDDCSPQELLARKVRELSLSKRPCTTVMGLGEYSIISVDAPDVPPAELRAALRWQVKDLIDFHIDDALIDVFDAPPSGAHGQKKMLYVVVSRTSTVRERVEQMQAAEANLTTIDIPELVLRNITTRLPEDEGGVAMVYLARERGLVVVSRESTLYFARTLDIGYDYLTQGLADTDELSLENNAVFDRLVLEVQRSLDYYDRYFQQPPVSALVLAPTEISIPGLPAYLHDTLGLQVKLLDLAEIVECEQELSSQQQAHCLAAVGAALREEATTL